ncbi:MAG: hexapeptide transferase, partial [Actinobacteria bacterium]|nr:hexapeptide transferase [Actinomycetota bacterium]
MAEMVVVGGGGHAKVLLSLLKKLGWEILGYTDEQDRGVILGIVHLGGDGVLPSVLRAHQRCSALIGVGKIDASSARGRLQREVRALGFACPA